MTQRPESWPLRVAARAVAWAIRLLGSTWRYRSDGDDPLAGGRPPPFVGAHWHRGLLCSAHRFRDLGVVIPVSLSRDGDRAQAVIRRLGFGPSPRGSSSRGRNRLLAGLIRAAQAGHPIGMLCDGPRGPARRAKQGVVAIARASGFDLRPIGVAARPCVELPSWDRMIVPLPFARVVYAWGGPIRIGPDVDRDELEAIRQRLETELDRLQERAESLVA
jgi:lysophospholipid acyltransferase (LPLAT)-like uncharacterized protein